jgi:two-component system, cell cycle sensor histidine kinase and response regulator CckA
VMVAPFTARDITIRLHDRLASDVAESRDDPRGDLTVDELREHVRELYEAQRAVEAERAQLVAEREAFAIERHAFFAVHQKALRQSEQRLRTIFQTEPDCVKLMTPDGVLLDINEAGVHMFEGDSVEALRGGRLDDLIDTEHRGAFAEMHAAVLRGEPGCLEFGITGFRGTRRWIETRAVAMADTDSGETVVLSICRDMTAQNQAQRALARNLAVVRRISSSLPLGFLVIDDRTNAVVHINEQFCETFGIPELLAPVRRGEISGKTVLERCAAVMVDPAAVAAACELFGDPDNRDAMEDEIACVDGRTLRRFSTPVRDEQGGYVARFWFFEDITTRRRAEQERARLEGQLHQAMKMQSVGRLAGGVAHDFNNMLGVILGHTEMALRSVRGSDPVHTDLTAIHAAAARSAALTRQLLAFASKQTALPQRLDLNTVISKSFHMLQRLISEDVALHWRPTVGLWPVRIDPSQLDQILTNLCVNARDAISDVGTVTIETANCVIRREEFPANADARSGEFVRLRVRDDGCGMEEAMVAQIFEPFYTTKQLGMGTGLGLATVYGTVKQHGGFIALETALSVGTTFDVYLPRLSGDGDEETVEPPPASECRGRETVLVVEDEPAILLLVSHILTGQGYHVLRANSPKAALELAAAHTGPIRLLLTDVIMPEMNGRELAAQLTARHPEMRALFMSGYTSDVIAKHGVLDDSVAFLQKPFSIDRLAAMVRDVLDREVERPA